jgi:hypothetical protein
MTGPTPPKIALPRGWKKHVRSAVLHVIALAQYAAVLCVTTFLSFLSEFSALVPNLRKTRGGDVYQRALACDRTPRNTRTKDPSGERPVNPKFVGIW